MPRMAARTSAQRIRNFATRRAPASRVVVLFRALLAFAATGLLAVPVTQASTDLEPVFLPAGEGRTLAQGPGGWTAATQVTAVACGVGGCPVLTAEWAPSIGLAGASDGALRARLGGLAGQSGVATATWRSPIVLAPAAAVGTLGVATRRVGVAGSATVVSTVSVRLVPLGGGSTRTGVEGAAIGGTGDGWTSGPSGQISLGALPLASLHRIEVELKFQFDSRASGQVDIDLDDPGLTALVARAAPPTADTAPPTDLPSPDSPRGGQGLPVPSEGDAWAASLLPGASLAACRDDEITVLGAAAAGGKLTVVGGSSRAPGTPVAVQSTDGWRLGGATIDANGLFRVHAREPAAAGRVVRVIARLPDGEASAPAAVARDNVLHRVRSVGGRWAVDGTLARSARGRSASVRLERAPATGCVALRGWATARATVDPKSGRYRASVAPPAGLQGRSALVEPGLFRVRVTTRGARSSRRVTTSQLILGGASDIAVH